MKDAKGHGSDARNGGLPVVRLDTVGSRQNKTGYKGSAKQETLALQRAADESRYPTSTVADRRGMMALGNYKVSDQMAAMSLGQGHPKSNEVPLGYGAAAAKTALWFGRNVAMARGADNRRKT